jgi:hypothetical protein
VQGDLLQVLIEHPHGPPVPAHPQAPAQYSGGTE